MNINPVSKRVYALAVLYDMQSGFFFSVTEGISDKDAHNRLNTKANHIAWLTGSLVQQRFELAASLKADPASYRNRQAAHELFKDNKGIQDNVTYPSLDTFKKDWEEITPVLRNAILKAGDDILNSPFDMPGPPMTIFDLLSFCSYREANCIGQIALWRRLLGYGAMKYM